MIILHKKRIIFIASCFIFSICAFYLFQNNSLNKEIQSVETVSLPVSNKVIVLDARAPEHRTKELKVQMEQQKLK